MCLSTIYKGTDATPENMLAEYVTSIEAKEGVLRLTDITGEELTITGALRHIDLISNHIFIEKNSSNE
jgi:predicted RNA-binding protein